MATCRKNQQYTVELENLPDREVPGHVLAKIWAETVYINMMAKESSKDETPPPDV